MRNHDEILAELEDIESAVNKDLSARIHERCTQMLEQLIPDNAPSGLVGAVIAGILAALLQDLWERSNEQDLALRTEALAAMFDALVRDYCSQFAILEQQPI